MDARDFHADAAPRARRGLLAGYVLFATGLLLPLFRGNADFETLLGWQYPDATGWIAMTVAVVLVDAVRARRLRHRGLKLVARATATLLAVAVWGDIMLTLPRVLRRYSDAGHRWFEALGPSFILLPVGALLILVCTWRLVTKPTGGHMADGLVALVTPPIFVGDVDEVDLAVFRTIREAEGFIEPQDVRDVVVFDGAGRRVDVEVEGRRTRLREARNADPQDSDLVARIDALAAAAQLEIAASPDNWQAFVDEAARAIESWMRR